MSLSSRNTSSFLRVRTSETSTPITLHLTATTGIFMGVSVSIVLFLILYVGVTAVAGLEVSYYAFSKEMGPAAQKKQQ